MRLDKAISPRARHLNGRRLLLRLGDLSYLSPEAMDKGVKVRWPRGCADNGPDNRSKKW